MQIGFLLPNQHCQSPTTFAYEINAAEQNLINNRIFQLRLIEGGRSLTNTCSKSALLTLIRSNPAVELITHPFVKGKRNHLHKKGGKHIMNEENNFLGKK